MNWYLAVLKNYTGFDGRARRTEFWMYELVNIAIIVVLEVLSLAVHPLAFLYYIYALAVLVPSLAVGCRRLHDTGKSGWLQLIGIIPILGAIAMIILWCLPGTPAPNKYGADPKAVAVSY
jgi:uncharacterized membrane protein YhaH (DUF805 family)